MAQMKKLAKMFGLELGEWFRLRRLVDQKCLEDTYVFNENGFWGKTKGCKRCYNVSSTTWQFLLTGGYEVVKIEKERKHGHWYTGFYFDKYKHAECSVCGYTTLNDSSYWKYCPMCGAIMDEVPE